MASTLQEQARALGDPTRHAVFRYVADADRPVDVAELTRHFGLNHNAIRQHLAKLVAADLVTEQAAPANGRGRPRLVYRANPSNDSRWGTPGPYERLSVLLAEILRSRKAPVDVGRDSVTDLDGTGPDDDPVATLEHAMARAGFDPETRRRGDRVELVLRQCPFESAALADAESVCAIHLGIAEGVAALTGERIVVDELLPNDPRHAQCRLRVHLTEAEEG